MEHIDLYYESLKEVFEQVRQWKPPDPPLLRDSLACGLE